jgi:hypothetical protein
MSKKSKTRFASISVGSISKTSLEKDKLERTYIPEYFNVFPFQKVTQIVEKSENTNTKDLLKRPIRDFCEIVKVFIITEKDDLVKNLLKTV